MGWGGGVCFEWDVRGGCLFGGGSICIKCFVGVVFGM